jgi:hypothetical protein
MLKLVIKRIGASNSADILKIIKDIIIIAIIEDAFFILKEKILTSNIKDKTKSNIFKENHGEIQANKIVATDAAILIVALSLKVFIMGKFEALLENRKIKPVTKLTKVTKNTMVSIIF